MEYLNGWDRMMPLLDIMDDFSSEIREAKQVNGLHFQFSFGDYVVKSLLGSIDPSLDKIDDDYDEHGEGDSECCPGYYRRRQRRIRRNRECIII